MDKLFAVLFGISIYSSAIAQWSVVNSGYQSTLNAIEFSADSVGYAVGDNGLVLKSIDTGNTWSQLNLGLSDDLLCIEFVSDSALLIGGDTGLVLYSNDGGITWTKPLIGSFSKNITSMYYQAPNIYIADGAISLVEVGLWTRSKLGFGGFGPNYVWDIVYLYDSVGIIGFYDEGMKKNTNALNCFYTCWSTTEDSYSPFSAFRLSFPTKTVGYAYTTRNLVSAKLLRSIDGGGGWNLVYDDWDYKFSDLQFTNTDT